MSIPSLSANSILLGDGLLTITGGGLYVNNVSQTGAAAQESTNIMSGNLTQTGVNLINRIDILSGQLVILNTGTLYLIGDQSVTGIKTFNSDLLIERISGKAVNNSSISLKFGNAKALNGNSSLDWGARRLYANDANNNVTALRWDDFTLVSGANKTLEWARKQLSGNWTTDGLPSESGHLVNKGYLENNYALLTGTQDFSGSKVFNNSIYIQDKIVFQTSSLYINKSGQFIENVSTKNFDPIGKKLYGGGNNVALDYSYRTLSGDWQANTLPTLSGHLINKFIFDNGIADAKNISLSTGDFSGPPANTITPAGWITITVNGGAYQIPVYN